MERKKSYVLTYLIRERAQSLVINYSNSKQLCILSNIYEIQLSKFLYGIFDKWEWKWYQKHFNKQWVKSKYIKPINTWKIPNVKFTHNHEHRKCKCSLSSKKSVNLTSCLFRYLHECMPREIETYLFPNETEKRNASY